MCQLTMRLDFKLHATALEAMFPTAGSFRLGGTKFACTYRTSNGLPTRNANKFRVASSTGRYRVGMGMRARAFRVSCGICRTSVRSCVYHVFPKRR